MITHGLATSGLALVEQLFCYNLKQLVSQCKVVLTFQSCVEWPLVRNQERGRWKCVQPLAHQRNYPTPSCYHRAYYTS